MGMCCGGCYFVRVGVFLGMFLSVDKSLILASSVPMNFATAVDPWTVVEEKAFLISSRLSKMIFLDSSWF